MIESAKRLLKANFFASRLNAGVKSAKLERDARRVAVRYEPRIRAAKLPESGEEVRALLLQRMRQAGVRPVSGSDRPLHVFCIGTYYEQENSGFLQALGRLGRLSLFYNAGGGYGLQPPSGRYDEKTIAANGHCLVEQVDNAMRDKPIDLVIGTLVAQSISVGALQAVRDRGIPVVNIAMDDRLPVHWDSHGGVRFGAIGLAEGTDLVLQTTSEYVPRYLLEGCPAVYWPFGSDADFFYPREPKKYDVVFVGNNYGWRGRLIDAVQKAGIRVECFGTGFPNGHIDAEAVAEVFGRARIVLGVGTVAHSSRVVTLKLRDFDGPMSGSMYLTTHNPDLAEHYELGREIETYRSVEECVSKIAHYLRNEDERSAIARTGRERALADHTWNQRLRAMVRMISAPAWAE